MWRAAAESFVRRVAPRSPAESFEPLCRAVARAVLLPAGVSASASSSFSGLSSEVWAESSDELVFLALLNQSLALWDLTRATSEYLSLVLLPLVHGSGAGQDFALRPAALSHACAAAREVVEACEEGVGERVVGELLQSMSPRCCVVLRAVLGCGKGSAERGRAVRRAAEVVCDAETPAEVRRAACREVIRASGCSVEEMRGIWHLLKERVESEVAPCPLSHAVQLLCAFGRRGLVESGIHEEPEFWNLVRKTLEATLSAATIDTYESKCAIFLLRCGGAEVPELRRSWEAFATAWEALDSHSTDFVRPAWNAALQLARQGGAAAFGLEWVVLLVRKLVRHYHSSTKKTAIYSLLRLSPGQLGRLADDVEFLDRVAMPACCDSVLFKGDLRLSSFQLVSGFVKGLLNYWKAAEKDTDIVLSSYLSAICAGGSATSGSAIAVHTATLGAVAHEGLCCVIRSETLDHLLDLFAICAECASPPLSSRSCTDLLCMLHLLVSPSSLTIERITRLLAMLSPLSLPGPEGSPPHSALCSLLCKLPQAVLIGWMESSVSSFISGESAPAADDIQEIHRRSADLCSLLVLLRRSAQLDRDTVYRCILPALKACANPYSNPYADPGTIDRSLCILGKLGATTIAPIITGPPFDIATVMDDGISYMRMRMEELAPNSVDRTEIYRDWLIGSAMGTRNTQVVAKYHALGRTLVDRLKNPDVPLVRRQSTVCFVHALVCRARVLSTEQECIDVFTTLTSRAEWILNDRSPQERSSGASAAATRKSLVSFYFWNLLRDTASAVGEAAVWSLDIPALLSMSMPTAKAAAAALAAVGCWPGIPPPHVFDKVAMDTFELLSGEAEFDQALCREWSQFVFQPKCVGDPSLHASVASFFDMALGTAERGSGLVNNACCVFIISLYGFGPAVWKAYLPLLLRLSLHGPFRTKSDTTASLNSAFDEFLVPRPAAPAGTGDDKIARASEDLKTLRATRDCFARLVAVDFLRNVASADVASDALRLANSELFSLVRTESSTKLSQMYTEQHRKQLRLLQLVCALVPRVDDTTADVVASTLSDMIIGESHASCRTFSCLALSRLAMRKPSRAARVVGVLEDPNQRASVLGAALVVCGNLLMNLRQADAARLALEVLPSVLPHLSGPLGVRVAAQSLLVVLFRNRVACLPEGFLPLLSGIERSFCAYTDTRKIVSFNRLLLSIGSFLGCRVVDVLHGLPTAIEDFPPPDIVPESCCHAIHIVLSSPLRNVEDGLGDLLSSPVSILPLDPADLEPLRPAIPVTVELWDEPPAEGKSPSTAGEVQTKAVPWKVGEEDESTREGRVRGKLIVVASLVELPVNVGGMCRTSDIFNVEELVVADRRIVSGSQFTAASVTAEKWVPITEVPPDSLAEYLSLKRSEGYSIFGVEQTNDSVPLQTMAWPVKSVIVLGREKTGLPAELIDLMDRCIEIPQLGVVRSLNVHVTSALVTWEYTKSHLIPKSS